jgi:hypothetical protein
MKLSRLSSLLPLLPLAAGCTATSPTGLIRDGRYYLEDLAPHVVDRRYIGRYACPDNVPLACECYSRLSQTCRCRC